MNNELEKKFETARKSISLSKDEKDFYRSELIRAMGNRKEAVPSPFIVPVWRYAFSLLLVLVLVFSGTVSASQSALPGDVLYDFKIKVAEPVRQAVAFTSRQKAELEIAMVDRRLNEYVQTADKNVNSEHLALATESLSEHLQEAQLSIADLQQRDDLNEALQANTRLKSTLAAHASILDQKEKAGKQGQNTFFSAAMADPVEVEIDQALAKTETEAVTLRGEVKSRRLTIDSVRTYQRDVKKELDSVRANSRTLAGSDKLDKEDRAEVGKALASVEKLVTEADQTGDKGSTTEAVLLYGEAEAQLTQLRTLLNADENLGIDLSETMNLVAPEATSTDASSSASSTSATTSSSSSIPVFGEPAD